MRSPTGPVHDQVQALLEAVVAVAADLTLDKVLDRIVTSGSQLVGARFGALGLLGADRRLHQFVVAAPEGSVRVAIDEAAAQPGLLGFLARDRAPLRLSEMAEMTVIRSAPDAEPATPGFLGVPIRVRGQAFGILYLADKVRAGTRVGDFDSEDEEIVVALAAAAGVAVANARLFEQAEQRRRWLEAASEITSSLLGEADRDAELALVARRAREVARADLAMIILPDGDDELVVEVLAGEGDDGPTTGPGSHQNSRHEQSLRGTRMPVEGTLTGQVVLSGNPIVVDDPPRASGEVRADVAVPEGPSFGPTLMVPLGTTNDVRGVLAVVRHPGSANFTSVDVALATTFANQAALALDRERAQADRAQLAVYEDRDRIGRDLHDLVIQRLFATGLQLQGLSRHVEPETAARISLAVDELDTTIRDIRATIFQLNRRLDGDDLRGQVRDVVQEAERALRCPARLELHGPVDEGVPDDVRPHLLAVLREALSNVARHARASSVDVTLAIGPDVLLQVVDDGAGLGEHRRGSGLRNMARRAEMFGGSFAIDGEVGVGTRLTWRVPLETPR